MNANEISPKINPIDFRLKKIQTTCSLLKRTLWIYVLFIGLLPIYILFSQGDIAPNISILQVFGHKYSLSNETPHFVWLFVIFQAGYFALGLVSFHRLLTLYQGGIFFAKRNVIYIKRLGNLLYVYGFVQALAKNISWLPVSFNYSQAFPDIYLSPLIFAGLFISLVAWIMDKGRIIQEEQELTV